MSIAPPTFPDISLWMAELGPQPPRPPLQDAHDYDVALVGGGYTGLWTAYYLKRLAPALRVCVLERDVCGFGASGRNGGWLMAALEGEATLLAGLAREARQRARQAILGILPEVEAVLAREGIDCDYHRGGGLFAAARYPEQRATQLAHLDHYRALGYSEADYRWLAGDELAARLRLHQPLGAIYTPHIARIHPAKLVRALAACVERLGVDVFEHSPVIGQAGGELHCAKGRVRAPVRLMAVEGFSWDLPAQRRHVLPVQSRVLATEPLSEAQWATIGLAGGEVFSDASPLITYAQRRADNRLVFGSRGSYRYGGQPRADFSGDAAAFAGIARLMRACLPQLEGVAVTHCWGGTLGIPRRGCPHAVFDAASGFGTAGGYLGEGVGASNLLARTLVDLVLARDSDLARAPWAHRGLPARTLRRWEPEPLRWLVYKATDHVLGREESACAAGAPRWQRRLWRGASAALAALRG
ncbi:NAD(P)/FAD-dependent oxidoreductase [Parahaliea mediterranea]|uniref:NAD(P)/FAD-dependent oxidoreductase n=1 Tax=Parahaliea mediterranea TaxID=651086 RepID=UPI0019D44CE9|nr:FAD-dependent oxidoreductase [Parahaliea mediterranea]